ncbi:hypothetical protein JQX13_38340 [Archangium violaceum]|uniref:glycoside hydrolase family protein n=1 Tax=Archangium violaceum TaxID=83451 RepID=UPI00193AF257|nr:hypothetical protein [Archangium violaceum]QRK05952.1 hypothetical protein JQX13_38340 [Archangium violaceum]
MSTPSNSQSAAQSEAQAQEARKKTESTNLSAGYRASLEFVLVPRTSITFDPPGAWSIGHPMTLLIDFPIRGSSKNFRPGDLKCGLTWLVDHGDKTLSYPVEGAVVMKIASNGRFEVKVDGKDPTVDLIAQRLIGKGKLGFSITPDFPHAEAAIFKPAIEFDNTCEIKVQKPQQLLLGERVTFTPEFAAVFGWADLELRVIELDEGSTEIAAENPRSAFSYRWNSGLSFMNFSRSWAIGFTDDSCHQLADVGEEEAGSYEFGWQLWGTRSGGQPTLLKEEKNFLIVPRPKLEAFKIEYDPSIEGTWEVSGKISGVSPRAELRLDIALVEPHAPGPVPLNPHATAIRLPLGADGIFEGYLGERHWLPKRLEAGALPLAPAYAILSLPAAARDGKPGPILPYLDFDDTKFSLVKGQALTWDVDADWICSMEGVSTQQRPPRPKRRKSGINTIPAPPPEAGDQKTPLTFDDMWNDLTSWEGVVAYMYLDTEGNVTVGAGNLVRTEEDAKKLPLQNMDAGRAATPEEIVTAFRAVKAMRPKMRATEYAMRPTIALTDQDIRALLKKRLDTEFIPRIRDVVFKPDFDTYPRCVRRALLDMVYNVGIGAFPNGFPKLTESVRARKWAVAAEQCRIKTGHETRNEWRKALYQYASVIDPPKRS